MILSKKDLKYYLECDRLTMVQKTKKPRLFTDETWKLLILLRKLEYLTNCGSGLVHKIHYCIVKYRFHVLSIKLGIDIGVNTFGPGLAMFHGGTTAVNGTARVGSNCQLYNGTNIALDCKIGNNVYIAPGAKILIGVTIADNIRIGANAVVSKSFLEPNITIAGIPAKKYQIKKAIICKAPKSTKDYIRVKLHIRII